MNSKSKPELELCEYGCGMMLRPKGKNVHYRAHERRGDILAGKIQTTVEEKHDAAQVQFNTRNIGSDKRTTREYLEEMIDEISNKRSKMKIELERLSEMTHEYALLEKIAKVYEDSLSELLADQSKTHHGD